MLGRGRDKWEIGCGVRGKEGREIWSGGRVGGSGSAGAGARERERVRVRDERGRQARGTRLGKLIEEGLGRGGMG